jgi:dihydrofolate reductase
VKTQYYTATSIDGFIADDQNSLEWLFQFGDGTGAFYDRFIAGVGAVVMGSTTYEWMLEHQVLVDPANPQPWPFEQPTWVLSTRELTRLDGSGIHFESGDVTRIHSAIASAAGGKNIWVIGGGDLAGQFDDAGLLDELILAVCPVSLGAGAPVFPRRHTTPFRLVSAVADGPFAMLTYELRR